MKYVVEQLHNVANGEDTLSEDRLDPPPRPDIDDRVTLECKISTIDGRDDTGRDEAGKVIFNDYFPSDESGTFSSYSTSKPGAVMNCGDADRDEADEVCFYDYFASDDSDSVSDNSTSKPDDVANRLAELAQLGVFGESSADGSSELTYTAMVDQYNHPDFQTSISVVMEDIEDQLDDIESPASPMDRHVYERLTSIYGYLLSL
ncbi:hypothetical protein ON010_g11526 [Phytophthora cinnamomi]|nr:hypothetical protein ON010_g11526 [Phytophthora cinnamomi]